MQYLIPLISGYVLGSLNPASFWARIKNIDIRKNGTKNLGATNTALLLGKGFGFAVMAFDILKGALAVILARLIFNDTAVVSGLIGGAGAVLGHIFPFYLKFKGGKGLATFGGMILAHNVGLFAVLLGIGLISMAIFKQGIALTLAAAVFFPVLSAIIYRNSDGAPTIIILSAAVSLLVTLRHAGNLKRAIKGEELTPSCFIKRVFDKRSD